MKKLLLFFFGLSCCYVYAQRNLATVDEFNGVKVFSMSVPVSDYEVLGEVSASAKGGVSMVNVGGILIMEDSHLQYNELRNTLIANAVLANREVEGIILQVGNKKSPSATMIKFKDHGQNNKLAKVNQFMGVYLFIDSTPESEYQFKKKVKINGLEGGYDDIIQTLTRKASKRKCNGVIIHFVTGGYDYGESIIL